MTLAKPAETSRGVPRVLLIPEWYPWQEAPTEGSWVREQGRVLSGRVSIVVLASRGTRLCESGYRPWRSTVHEEAGVTVIRLRYWRPRVHQLGFIFRLLGVLSAARRFRAVGWHPQVVHAYVFSSAWVAFPLARLAGATFVVSEHYSGVARRRLGRWDRFIARMAYKRADVLTVASRNLIDAIRALCADAHPTVMPNIVDTAVFEAAAARVTTALPPPYRLVAIGSLSETKDFASLLEAVALLGSLSQKVRLDIIGEGPLHASLAAQISRLGLESRVRLVGGLEREQVAKRLA